MKSMRWRKSQLCQLLSMSDHMRSIIVNSVSLLKILRKKFYYIILQYTVLALEKLKHDFFQFRSIIAIFLTERYYSFSGYGICHFIQITKLMNIHNLNCQATTSFCLICTLILSPFHKKYFVCHFNKCQTFNQQTDSKIFLNSVRRHRNSSYGND